MEALEPNNPSDIKPAPVVRESGTPHHRCGLYALRCVSIDVEEYFQIEAAQGTIKIEQWNDWPWRVQRNMDLLLELLAKLNRKGTFFFLGWIAQKHPQLAKQVAAAGHEIASHGFMHQRLHRLDPQTFGADIESSRKILQDQTGQPVIGYRAPTFSVTPQTKWAVEVLVDAGFRYDASVFPVYHPLYGVPAAPDRPFILQGQKKSIVEFPPLTWRIGSKKLAVAGGGYFRLLPLWFMRRGLKQAACENRPAVLYFHPWEFDPDMPKMPLPASKRVRTYTGLKKSAAKLEKILALPGQWMRMDELLAQTDVNELKTFQL